MSEEQKYCLVCGKALAGRQKKYCSKKCMGLSKQGIKFALCVEKSLKILKVIKIVVAPMSAQKYIVKVFIRQVCTMTQ